MYDPIVMNGWCMHLLVTLMNFIAAIVAKDLNLPPKAKLLFECKLKASVKRCGYVIYDFKHFLCLISG